MRGGVAFRLFHFFEVTSAIALGQNEPRPTAARGRRFSMFTRTPGHRRLFLCGVRGLLADFALEKDPNRSRAVSLCSVSYGHCAVRDCSELPHCHTPNADGEKKLNRERKGGVTK